jgi:CubicO group peptidase (beta-lactamase class C family)
MIKKSITIALIIIVCSWNLNAQSTPGIDSVKLMKWIEAENSICLLRNEDNIIPMKELENKSIACISIGNDTLNMFHARLSNYAKIDFFNFNKTVTDSVFVETKHQLKSYNIVICALHDLDKNQRMAFGLTKQMGEMVDFLTDSANAIIVLFGDGHSINELKNINKAKALIFSPSESADYQDVSAQIIFGGIGAKGKLKVSTKYFENGFGLSTNGGIRFKFTIPEEFDINRDYLDKKIDSIVENGIRQQAFPGCQILAARDGKIFFYKTYGFHTYDSINEVKKSDLYDLASITKISTALPALMKLYDENKINPDSKFVDYWPDFKKSDKSEITIREALTHQAGFVPSIGFWKKTLGKNGKYKRHICRTEPSKNYPVKISPSLYLKKNYYRQIYKTIRKTKLKEKREYLYSDLPSIIYPKIIETITNKKYEEYLNENFYKPLGASTLTYNPYKKYDKNNIVPTEYDSVFRKKLVHGYVHDESAAMLGGISGNAGLFGNALDLAKLMQMYLNMGVYGGQQLINTSTLKEFTRCQFPENNNRRALGFDKPLLKNKEKGSVAPSASDNSFGHTGFTGTLCWADPDTGILFVFLSNRIYPTRNNSKLFELNIRPSLHQIFYNLILEAPISGFK